MDQCEDVGGNEQYDVKQRRTIGDDLGALEELLLGHGIKVERGLLLERDVLRVGKLLKRIDELVDSASNALTVALQRLHRLILGAIALTSVEHLGHSLTDALERLRDARLHFGLVAELLGRVTSAH